LVFPLNQPHNIISFLNGRLITILTDDEIIKLNIIDKNCVEIFLFIITVEVQRVKGGHQETKVKMQCELHISLFLSPWNDWMLFSTIKEGKKREINAIYIFTKYVSAISVHSSFQQGVNSQHPI